MDFSTLLQPILQNQVVTGLSFTAILGAAAYQLRTIPHMIRQGTLRFFTVQLTVMSTDASFEWMDRWLARQPYAKKSKMLTLRSHASADAEVPTSADKTSNGDKWELSPGPGMHMFWWNHRPIILDRSFMTKDPERNSKPIELLHLRTFGRSQQIIRKLITEIHQLSVTSEMVQIRMWVEYYWCPVRGKSHRPLDTIVLKSGQTERIIGDLEWFLQSRDWYKQRGIPYRRGYLFSGKAGTGKTSIVLALAGYLNRPVCILNLGSVENDDALFSAVNQAPPDAIILIEDIDCAATSQSRDAGPDAEKGKITKAGLLNALDGITTPDGRIFIMTTNFPERLDAALLRPGRADVHEAFAYLDHIEQVRMATRFYDGFEPLPFPVSPAVMQGAFMQHPRDSASARDMLLQNHAETA